MSDLNDSTIDYLAKLCRIACTDDEKKTLMHDLKKVLDHIDNLKEVDTDNVPACNHVLESHLHMMREDDVGEILPRDEFLENSPDHVGGMIKVPPMIAK